MDKKIIINILILREADNDILNQNYADLVTIMDVKTGQRLGGS